MSGTHRHTWQQHRVGHLNITVQLDSAAESTSLDRHKGQADVARQLITTMDAERLPTTWAVSDPAHSAATALIVKSAIDHELAVLGDTNWVGPTAGRTRFARELARRLAQARAAGLQVTTLMPCVANVESDMDLIVKLQITALVGLATSLIPRQTAGPQALHYGVWEVPLSASLPMKTSWFTNGKRTLSRRIERTVAEAGGFHLLIDAGAIAASKRHDAAVAKWLLRRIAILRDRGLLQVETMRATANRLSDVPSVSPQRSILRGAA
ncbi:MAG TPA: hypothetical protein VH107_14505 [Lacipirellulaceae bacterium]|jgi:hypothetical protein|nr:hypothetical protein [Lacipirellulaceae bacterium]